MITPAQYELNTVRTKCKSSRTLGYFRLDIHQYVFAIHEYDCAETTRLHANLYILCFLAFRESYLLASIGSNLVSAIAFCINGSQSTSA